MSEVKTKAVSAERALTQKWGATLMRAGFTALPDVIFKYQKALNLKSLDVLIILHLSSFWWSASDLPWPSKAKLAEGLDVDPSTVRRSIKRLEELGYIKRIYRKAEVGDNQSNKYDLRGLVAAAEKYAKEEINRRGARAAEDRARKTTPRAFKLLTGGKTGK
ncbi:helix-turn-helix domain-containing protein [Leptospira sp. 96542]|nr:helix-turn-helix domain-containing protein [Leptospira sp. 96542]